MMAKIDPWQHDALAVDLARHLMKDGKVWTWLNSTIGAWSGPRPDIMAYRRYSYDRPLINAFEIKVSRADLLGDLNKGKWRSYLEHCASVTFVMPSGLATKDEIPAECGLMFRTGRGWRTERRAETIGSPCSVQAMAKLLTMHPMTKPPEAMNDYRLRDVRTHATRQYLAKVGHGLSAQHARYLRCLADGQDPVAEAQTRADEISAKAKALVADFRGLLHPMLDELGLPHDADEWAIKAAIRKRIVDLNADKRVAAGEQALASARQALGYSMPSPLNPEGGLFDG